MWRLQDASAGGQDCDHGVTRACYYAAEAQRTAHRFRVHWNLPTSPMEKRELLTLSDSWVNPGGVETACWWAVCLRSDTDASAVGYLTCGKGFDAPQELGDVLDRHLEAEGVRSERQRLWLLKELTPCGRLGGHHSLRTRGRNAQCEEMVDKRGERGNETERKGRGNNN